MSYAKERDEFLSIMGGEKIPVSVTRALLRHATTLQKLAELECSSERADRDRVPCPAATGWIPPHCRYAPSGGRGSPADARARRSSLDMVVSHH